jgi:hypothetical protein
VDKCRWLLINGQRVMAELVLEDDGKLPEEGLRIDDGAAVFIMLRKIRSLRSLQPLWAASEALRGEFKEIKEG